MARAIRSALARLRKRRPGSAALSGGTTPSHRHSALGLLPPVVVHHGQAAAVSSARQQTLDVAYAEHPARFVSGRPVPPAVPDAVWINPPLPQQQPLVAALATAAPVPTTAPVSRV